MEFCDFKALLSALTALGGGEIKERRNISHILPVPETEMNYLRLRFTI